MTKPSLTMNVRKGCTVIRDGQRVRPQIGKDFTFSADERDSILSADPGALVKATGEEGEATVGTVTASAEQSQAKATGGRKKATANKSDAENASDGDGNAPDNSEPLNKNEGQSSTADETAGDDDL